jgi:hypothetical protein
MFDLRYMTLSKSNIEHSRIAPAIASNSSSLVNFISSFSCFSSQHSIESAALAEIYSDQPDLYNKIYDKYYDKNLDGICRIVQDSIRIIKS